MFDLLTLAVLTIRSRKMVKGVIGFDLCWSESQEKFGEGDDWLL